ncbi:MAG: tRNA pseudouridine(38-40) synthase TruA [Deltaproteobacteria bacterium]|nr:tRNA pseudouridine(38-40) synthase TruA [Deltaproteobacteria bacterium]
MPQKTFRMVVQYDGARFCGWQRQGEDPTVQLALEQALSRMTGRAVVVHGSGRTDAGVHALGQAAHVVLDTRLTADEIQKGLNALLPEDVAVTKCTLAAEGFHARYDAKSKLYAYHFASGSVRPVVGRQYCWWIKKPLDHAAMARAAEHFLGTRDFSAMEAAGSPRSHSVRTVMESRVTIHGQNAVYWVRADGFLRHMVRNMAGTLAWCGTGRMDPDAVPALLESRDRKKAPPTAPAKGLFLVEVEYGKERP